MKKTFKKTKGFVSLITVLAMLCTMFTGVTIFADETTTSKEPTSVFAVPRSDSKGVQIAWKNPTDTTLSKTEVYKINNLGESQTYTLVEANNAPVAGAYAYANDEFATAYTSSTTVFYKVVCTFRDGSSNEVITYTNPYCVFATYGNQPFIDGSKYVAQQHFPNTNYVGAVGAELDWDVKNGDGPSVHLKSSFVAGSNAYQFRYQFAAPEANSYIKISFKYKTENTTGYTYVQLPNSYADDTATNAALNELNKFTGTNDWTDFSVVRKVGTGCPFVQFNVQTPGDIWIDDVFVYLCDASGNTTGDNLVTQTEAFAADYYEANTAISVPVIADYNAYDSAADLTWNAVSGATAYRVYEKAEDDSLALRAEFPAAVTYAKFDNLVNDTEYTYVVKAVDALTKETAESNAVTVTPQAPVVELPSKEPSSVFAVPRSDSKGVQVAWKNPTDSTLVKTEVYKVDNMDTVPSYTLVEANNAPVAGAYAYANDEFETAYTESTTVFYKVVCTFRDGSSNEVMTYTNPYCVFATYGNQPFIDGSKYVAQQHFPNTNYVGAVGAELDWDVKNGDGPSVHLKSSFVAGSNAYQSRYQFAAPEANSYIKISFKYKTENTTGYTYVQLPNSYADDTATKTGLNEITKFTGTNDWTDFSVVRKVGTGCPFVQFNVQTPGDIWIDDVFVYLCDASGNTTGDNLVTQTEAFAADYYEANGMISIPVIADYNTYDSAADLTWNAVSGATAYRVYEKAEDDSLALRAELPASVTYVRFNNLVNDTEYTYVVKAVDALTKETAESAEVTVIPAIPQATQSEKEPTSVFAAPRSDSKGVQVAWKNPTTSTLAKTEVYRIDNIDTAPTYALVATNNAPVPGSYAYANDEFETAYTESTSLFYKVVCTFQDGSSNEVITYTNPYCVFATYGNQPFIDGSKYIVQRHWANEKYVGAVDTELDWDVKSGDGPSVHLKSSFVAGSNAYQFRYQFAAPEANSYIKISFKYKTENTTGYTYVQLPNSYANDTATNAALNELNKFTGTNDWTDFSVVKKVGTGCPFVQFNVQTPGDIWIDDVSVYLCDASGNTTGENLVTSPDVYFTDSYYTSNPVPAAPVISDTDERDGGVDISWAEATNATGYEVYEKTDENEYYLRASVPANITTVRLNNLINNKAYSFVVKAMDITTKGSAFSEAIELTPQPDPFKVSDYAATRNGSSLTVSADMKNGTYTNGLTANLIVAVYKKGNVLSMSTVALGEAKTIALGVTEMLTATVTLPSDYTAEGYTVKAFLWDSATSMKPYIGEQNITVPAIN